MIMNNVNVKNLRFQLQLMYDTLSTLYQTTTLSNAQTDCGSNIFDFLTKI